MYVVSSWLNVIIILKITIQFKIWYINFDNIHFVYNSSRD